MSAKKPPRSGAAASKNGAPRSRRDSQKLGRLLKAVFNDYQRDGDRETSARCWENFVFHMTDWTDDLRALAELYAHPARHDVDSAGKTVFSFLAHAVPHLRAAARNLDVPARDIFRDVDKKRSARS